MAAAVADLPPDILANIHGRLILLDRLAIAAAFRSSRDVFTLEAPCLVLPGDSPETATLFSFADRGSAVVRAVAPDHLVLGSSSSRRWLVTADAFAQMRLVNPVTGERRALPAIDPICLSVSDGRQFFTVDVKWFLRGPPPYPFGTMTYKAEEMRRLLYRKVVLSDSADIAMLITGPQYGVPAFAKAGGAWRLAPPRDGVEPVATSEGGSWRPWHSRNGVEDAIHHGGRFYSVTYSSEVEAWEERDVDTPGVFTSTVVAPSLPLTADPDQRKYLVAAPGWRLMVVLKETTGPGTLPSFRVLVLDADGEGWQATDDIDDAALFVGSNGSLCVSTRDHPELRASCIYYTADGHVVVLSLKGGTAEQVEGHGTHRSWPPLEWFTPCIVSHHR